MANSFRLLYLAVCGWIYSLPYLPTRTSCRGVSFPLPNEESVIPESWGVHEMMTTANFASRNLVVNTVCGGLNFQVEHHLFPNVSHGHYRHIALSLRKPLRNLLSLSRMRYFF